MDEITDNINHPKNFLKGTVIVVGLIVGILLFQHYVSKKTSFHDMLVKTAEELNRNCPMMADNDTRLDSAVALPGNILQYNYTFINLVKDSLDAELLSYSLKPAMIGNARKNRTWSFSEKTTLLFCIILRIKKATM
jgi:hypothetical protein